MGDFNFGSDKNFSLIAQRRRLISQGKDPYSIQHSDLNEVLENEVLRIEMPDYEDIWENIHPNDPGYTFNSHLNPNIYSYEEMRYDRMIMKSTTWIATLIEIVGNEPVGTDNNGNIFLPSDHFGLFMEMNCII